MGLQVRRGPWINGFHQLGIPVEIPLRAGAAQIVGEYRMLSRQLATSRNGDDTPATVHPLSNLSLPS